MIHKICPGWKFVCFNVYHLAMLLWLTVTAATALFATVWLQITNMSSSFSPDWSTGSPQNLLFKVSDSGAAQAHFGNNSKGKGAKNNEDLWLFAPPLNSNMTKNPTKRWCKKITSSRTNRAWRWYRRLSRQSTVGDQPCLAFQPFLPPNHCFFKFKVLCFKS